MVNLPVKIAAIILIGIVVFLYARRAITVGPGAAGQEIAGAVGQFGQSLGQFGQGVGTGLSGLLNPGYAILDLFGRARSLIYGTPAAESGAGTPAARTQSPAPMPTTPRAMQMAAATQNAQQGRPAAPRTMPAAIQTHYRLFPNLEPAHLFNADGTPTAITQEFRRAFSAHLDTGRISQDVQNYYLGLISRVPNLFTETNQRRLAALAGR